MSTGEGILWAACIVVGVPIALWIVFVVVALVIALITGGVSEAKIMFTRRKRRRARTKGVSYL